MDTSLSENETMTKTFIDVVRLGGVWTSQRGRSQGSGLLVHFTCALMPIE